MTDESLKTISKSPLEQFLLLSKNAKGAAAAQLIKQATEAQGVYVFGELVQMKNIQELSEGEFAKDWKVLNLFAYGTFKDYEKSKDDFRELSPTQIMKLRHLTILSLALKTKHIPYMLLLEELGMRSLRELEDLIIDGIYAGILQGKLDQKRKQLEVEFVLGRDIQPETIDDITKVLEDWCSNCEGVLQNLEKQIQRANSTKEKKQKQKKQIETEVDNLKKAIKSQSQEMSTDDADSSTSYQNQQYQKALSQPKSSKGSKTTLKATAQSRGR